MYVGVSLLLVILPLATIPQDDPAALIRKLSSDSIQEREAAEASLKKAGEFARTKLHAASLDSNAEIATRAKVLLRRLDLIRSLGPRLLKAFPDLAERLAAGDPSDWTQAFLEAARLSERPGILVRDDLMVLLGTALQGVRTEREAG